MQRMKLQIWWRKKIKTKKKIRGEEFIINIQISYHIARVCIISYDMICPYAFCNIFNQNIKKYVRFRKIYFLYTQSTHTHT